MGDAQEVQALSNVRRWQSTADGCLIQTAPEDTSNVRASPPERQKWHPRTPTRPVAPLLYHPLNRGAFRHHNISLRDARLRQVQDLFLLPGPLFFSYYFVVCNLSKHIQLAPDFVEHDRVYHPRCTFGAPSTADIEESLNNPGRFGGCLLFEDREVADALSKRHLNVKQIVVSACPVPPLLSDPTLRCQNYKLGGLLESLVRLVFRDCDELTELPSNLSRCQALRTLVVHRCSYLRRLTPLADESLTKESKLHHLFLIACPRLQDTLDLANLPTLRLCVARQCGLLTVVVNHENNAPTELLQLVISQVFRMQAEPSADQVTHCDRSYSGEEPEGEELDTNPAAGSKYITLPPSLQNFGFEWTNSECPAIESITVPSQDEQNQEQPSSHLRGVSFCRYTLLECLPRHICTRRLEKLAMIGCTSLDQKQFVRDDLHTLTSLRQLRVSLAFDQLDEEDFRPPEGTALTLLTLSSAQRNYDEIRAVPDWVFRKLPQLRSLDISDCPKLRAVPSGLSALQQLRLLAVRRCSSMRLTSVPQAISHLAKLTSLDLEGCSSIRTLPSALGCLSRLKRLNLCDCSSLTFLPQSVHRLTCLTYLVLAHCEQLHSLPRNICTWKPAEARQPLQEFSIPDEPVWPLAWVCACILRPCVSGLRRRSAARDHDSTHHTCVQVPNAGPSKKWGPCCHREVLASWRALELAVPSVLLCGLLGMLAWVSVHELVLGEASLKFLGVWVAVGAGIGLANVVWMRVMEVRLGPGGTCARVSETCLVDTTGSGLPQPQGRAGTTVVAVWNLQKLMVRLEEQQQQSILDVLVRDRQGRTAALERLALVGVLLATAAQLSFRISPSLLKDFAELDDRTPTNSSTAPPAASPAPGTPAIEQQWLKTFYATQHVTFILSIALILYVFVIGIPANLPVDDLIVAGSSWVQFTFGCCLLVAALLSSMFAFSVGALAVYEELMLGLYGQRLFAITGWLIVGLLYAWGYALYRIWPGWAALRAFAVCLFRMHVWGDWPVMRGPVKNAGETVGSMEAVVKDMKKELQDLRLQSAQQIRLLKETAPRGGGGGSPGKGERPPPGDAGGAEKDPVAADGGDPGLAAGTSKSHPIDERGTRLSSSRVDDSQGAAQPVGSATAHAQGVSGAHVDDVNQSADSNSSARHSLCEAGGLASSAAGSVAAAEFETHASNTESPLPSCDARQACDESITGAEVVSGDDIHGGQGERGGGEVVESGAAGVAACPDVAVDLQAWLPPGTGAAEGIPRHAGGREA